MNSSQSRPMTHCRMAVTVIELIVVTAIAAGLMSLLLTAMQSARESSRKMKCQNNLKQIGIALLGHEAAFNRYPSNGWGYLWIGEPERGSGVQQPGGWIYNVLPFLEQQSIHDIPLGVQGEQRYYATSRMLAAPAIVFHCPTRGRDALSPNFLYGRLNNSLVPKEMFQSDYAANAGSLRISSRPGPDTYQMVADYTWAKPSATTGLFLPRFSIRTAQVLDGLSNTYLIGEKSISRSLSVWDLGDNQPAYAGDCQNIRRVCYLPPQRNRSGENNVESFGSMHVAGWNVVFADGAVRQLTFDIDLKIHIRNGSRDDLQFAALASQASH